jgi:hypothetical protein
MTETDMMDKFVMIFLVVNIVITSVVFVVECFVTWIFCRNLKR